MPVDSVQLIVARIDERTKIIDEKIADLQTSIEKLNSIVFTGNGRESIVTRMSRVEDDFDRYLEQCEQCRAAILVRPHDDESSAIVDLAKTKVVEEWKFLTAVVVAMIGILSTLILALKP